jgi:hypothetical protein
MLPFLIENQMAPGLHNLSILYKIYLLFLLHLPLLKEVSVNLKSYMRLTNTNERLSGLALLSIERGLDENIDFESTINRFASMISCRKQFT